MKEVVWNHLALADYHNNLDYLLKEWTEQDALNFMDEVEAVIFNLKQGNIEFKESGYKDIKQCVVRKQITLYYKHRNNTTIELLRFWNNYQDDKKLRF